MRNTLSQAIETLATTFGTRTIDGRERFQAFLLSEGISRGNKPGNASPAERTDYGISSRSRLYW